MTTAPARTRDYVGPVTDTRTWDSFALRPGDIILSTPPKCGTTWSQAILMMLLEGAAVTDRPIWRESTWLDCGFRDQQRL
jgi:aryl sulfotransferase